MTQPAPRGQRSADLLVDLAGRIAMAFGLAITILGVITRPGVGSFGLVPEAMAGLTSVLLGGIAVLMAKPPRATHSSSWPRPSAGTCRRG